MILPELLCRRYKGMDSTYLSMAGSSSHAFTRVNEAQGSAGAARMLGVVGVVGSLLFATDDVSAKTKLATVDWDSSRDLFSPEGAIVNPSVTDGSGSGSGAGAGAGVGSTNTLEGFGC